MELLSRRNQIGALVPASPANFILIQFPPLWFVGAVVVIAFGIWQIYALPLRPLRSLLDERDGSLSGIMSAQLKGHYQGRAAKFKCGGHGRNSEQLEIALASSLPCSFQVRKKSLGAAAFRDVLAVTSGGRLAIPEIPAGDSETMRSLTFFPGTNPHLLRWLQQTEVQEMIGSLFVDRGVDTLTMGDGYLSASCLFVFRKKYKPENVRCILDDMGRLLRNLETL